MANISSKVDGHNGAMTDFWISQINAGNQTYDIATHHSITFKDGSSDKDGVTWNGLTDLEVIIPSITDIVQSPIVFAGTVGEGGKITGNESHKDVETSPKEGYLVFVTVDCTFAGLACEAGDMAIYDGSAWKVVSGENQVSIVGNNGEVKTTVMVGSVKDVLTVEGKTLAIGLDYEELNKHVSKTTGESVDVSFKEGDMQVAETSFKLNYTPSENRTINTTVSFENATTLSDGKVTFNNDTVVTDVEFGTFKQGSFPTYKSNVEKTFDVKGGSLTASTPSEDGDYVASVSLSSVTFTPADESDANRINVITGLTSISDAGNVFLSGIHSTDIENNEKADFTITGVYVPTEEDVKFVKGLADGSSVITSINAGEFKLVEGVDLATGFTTSESESGDVISSVSVTANNDTDVFSSATVSDHVLSFETTKVTSNVSTTCMYKSLTKTGISYTPTTFTSSSFITSGFTKTSDINFTFSKANETTYSATPEMWKLNTPELVVSKGKYTLDNTNMKATVGANTFLTGIENQGELPSLTGMSFTTNKLTGNIGTALSTTTVNINALASDVTSIAVPGTYTLTTASKSDEGAITVGAAGNLAVNKATVNLEGYLKDVSIITTVVSN